MRSRPSVLFITTDEQHRASLSCWGARSHCTPHIDALADGGAFFERAYSASPICLPSRCSMATGLYPHNSRSYSNHTGASLGPRLRSIMQICRALGYRTSLHGKGHFMPCPYGVTQPRVTRDLACVKPFYLSRGLFRFGE